MIGPLVADTIRRYRMLERGDRVLVAVSGGPDSVALLRVLADLAPGLRLDLHVAHLDHGWRGRASRADAEFVRRLALRLGIPVTIGHARRRAGRYHAPGWSAAGARRGRHPSSREALARAQRYAFLMETAASIGARRVALGHNRDDQAETLLMRLLRGSGTRGLGAIHPSKEGVFIRPLIEVRRSAILAFLKDRRMRYRVDATNRDVRFMRNRVRRLLLPLLEKRFNPAIVERLAQTADLMREDEAFLETLAAEAFARAVVRRRPGCVDLRAGTLRGLPVALQRRVLRRASMEVRGTLLRLTARHVERCRDLLGASAARSAVCLPGGAIARLVPGALRLERTGAPGAGARRRPERPGAASSPGVDTLCPVPGRVDLPEFGLRLRARVEPRPAGGFDPKAGAPDRVYLDADLARGPLRIRARRPGDRFHPLGAPGSRKVKAFLIDRKVPVDARGAIPLVMAGGRIAWVVSQAIDERFRVTGRTRRILVLEKETA